MNSTATITRSSAITVPQRLTVLLPFIGALVITLTAQIRIDLGFTPVPITGQTFSVVLWGLLFGARQGALAAAAYVAAGAVGIPVFAGFTAFLGGSNSGYLLGFIPGAWVAGWLAERGWTRHFLSTTLSGLVAHIPILVVGSILMSAAVGLQQTWQLAIAPFLIGDVIKSVAAATVVAGTQVLRRGT